MKGRALPLLLVAPLSVGCASGITHRSGRDEDSSDAAERELAQQKLALQQLLDDAGPVRFAEITPRLFRGGQPSHEQLALLRAAGVRRVINLRRERLDIRKAEREEAHRLGIELVEFPFYGVFGANKGDLDRVLLAMHAPEDGGVYIHCKNGRDRTSLLVALYRVCVEGWKPQDAWEREVLGYDHEPSRFYRQIGVTFEDVVAQHLAELNVPEDPAGRP